MLLVDTGVLLAAADSSDPDHKASVRLLEDEPGPLVTSPLVLAEVAYLIDRQLGPAAEAAFFESVAEGDLGIEELGAGDFRRMAELIAIYADLPLGGTDASLVVLAERHRLQRIATLDRRHFGVVRPSHTAAWPSSRRDRGHGSPHLGRGQGNEARGDDRRGSAGVRPSPPEMASNRW